MTETSLWSWFVPLAAAAAILASYFLKLRRRPVLVPSTYLWRRTIEDRRVNALWQRLRRSLFLFLQLAAVAAAAVALLRPSWPGSQLVGGRYVFVVDNSASMAGTDIAPTRLDEAKSRTLSLIDKMGSGDTAMVVSFASHARIEQAFTDHRDELRRAVKAILPTDESTSLDEALRLCGGGETPATAFVFSDGNFPDVGDDALGRLPIEFVPIGTTTTENLAVTRLAVRRSVESPRRAQAFMRIGNFGSVARQTDVELLIEGRLADARRLSLAAKSHEDVVFTVEDAPDGVWEVRLDGGDQLPIDDRAWAVLEPPTKTRLLVVSPGNRFLAAALATDEARTWCDATYEEPEFLTSEEYRRAATGGRYDAIVFDRCRPDAMPECHTLFFAAAPPQGGWRFEAAIAAPAIVDVAQTHSLMQNTNLGDVIVAEARPTVGPPGSRTLIDSSHGPLAVSASRDGYEDAVFGFALVGDDGAAQTDWPLIDGAGFEQFVLNAGQHFGRRAGNEGGESLQPGTPVRLAVEPSADDVTVEGPDGRRTPVPPTDRAERTFFDTNRVGPYRVWQGKDLRERWVVNLFDPRESDAALAASPSLRVGQEEIIGQASWEATRWEGWKPFLLLVLALLGIEWYMYGRRGGL